MKALTKCPYCGADKVWESLGEKISYYCDSHVELYPKERWYRTENCYNRQISQLQERLEAWREFGKSGGENEFTWINAVDKLKELGEI